MNFDTALAILDAKLGNKDASVQVFRTICCNIWTDTCSLKDFIYTLCNDPAKFMLNIERGDHSAIEKLSIAINELLTSDEVCRELGCTTAKGVMITFRSAWKTAMCDQTVTTQRSADDRASEYRHHANATSDDEVDNEYEDECDYNDASDDYDKYADSPAATSETAEEELRRVKRRYNALHKRAERLKCLFADYVTATDDADRSAIIAQIIRGCA